MSRLMSDGIQLNELELTEVFNKTTDPKSERDPVMATTEAEKSLLRIDIEKTRFDNPEDILAGRLAPINIPLHKMLVEIKKEKQKFRDFLHRLSISELHRAAGKRHQKLKELAGSR